MADKIPVRYLPTEESVPALGEFRPDETVPVAHGGTGASTAGEALTSLGGVGSSDSSVSDIVAMTQAEYDAIGTPNPTTLYLITGP